MKTFSYSDSMIHSIRLGFVLTIPLVYCKPNENEVKQEGQRKIVNRPENVPGYKLIQSDKGEVFRQNFVTAKNISIIWLLTTYSLVLLVLVFGFDNWTIHTSARATISIYNTWFFI